MPRKIIYLISGNEDRFLWDLRLGVVEKTTRYEGYFFVTNPECKEKLTIRRRDRAFFNARLGKGYMKDKVVHHEWDNTSDVIWTFVLDKNQHLFGALGKKIYVDRKRWIDREEWLICGKE